MENKSHISITLYELMESHGISPEKLSTITTIPVKFISSLLNDEFSKLPPEPYVRGYLLKIARALKADQNELLKIYKESAEAAKSGAFDKLPENRFRKDAVTKGWIIGLILTLIIGSFFFLRFKEIFGIASLSVNIPTASASESLVLSGMITPGDQLTINGEIVYTDEVGRFEKEVILVPGINQFEFKAKRFLGRETKIVRQVYFEPINNIPTPSND